MLYSFVILPSVQGFLLLLLFYWDQLYRQKLIFFHFALSITNESFCPFQDCGINTDFSHIQYFAELMIAAKFRLMKKSCEACMIV